MHNANFFFWNTCNIIKNFLLNINNFSYEEQSQDWGQILNLELLKSRTSSLGHLKET